MKEASLLPDEVIELAKNLNTTLLADVMGCTGAMDYRIKPVSSGMGIVGTAMTVSLRPGDNLFLHQAIYSAKKGYVLVVDGKGHTNNAYLGELMAGSAKAIGVEGIVIDGLVRDKKALEELDFPIYSKGFHPNGPFKDGPGEVNEVISCGGIRVAPGDLVVADDDGVVVVPVDRIDEVLHKASEKLKYEEKRLETIAQYGSQEDPDPISLVPKWLESKIKQYRA
ncbi:RraA family protein [Terribacillus sp. 7520-G]|uniref:RraA family protein n=1 Tax=unclassified Terribacillus TaxID=2636508 RepID=UPI000BA5E29E|nr:RraA family protein [Terribacillus sp. 7520-G]PAD39192.1 S-adenosylmethionine--2-demethylmenaquinone methyltransferase [Terribacillus sp. 7520-G]